MFAMPLSGDDGSAGAKWTIVSYTVDSPSTNNATTITSSAINTTTADMYLVVVFDLSTAVAGTLTNNSTANTYTLDTSYNGTGGSYRVRVYRSSGPVTNNAQTWTYSSINACIPVIYCIALKGSATNPRDQRNLQLSTGIVTSVGTGGITPTANNTLLVAAFASGASGAPTISGGGFSNSNRIGFTTVIGNRQWATAVYITEQITAASSSPTLTFPTSSFGAAGSIRNYLSQ